MKAYKKNPYTKSKLKGVVLTEGETIEQKIRRMMNNNEPMSEGAKLIYSERKDGVLPEYDIRNDKFETALEAKSKIAETFRAQREKNIVDKIEKENPPKKGKTEESKD